MNSTKELKEARDELREIRRRLGPYTAVQHEPYRMADAEIARRVVDLSAAVERLAIRMEIQAQALRAIGVKLDGG